MLHWKTSRPTLLAVFAHPDDETFRPGGTLALLARGGVDVHVLTATCGQAGGCGDPPLCTPQELPAVRAGELQRACQALGLHPPYVLNYTDGCLAEADGEQLARDVLAAVQNLRPQVLLSFGPDGISGHPDHRVIGHAAQQAYNRTAQLAALYSMAVPASLVEALDLHQLNPIPDHEIALCVDIASVWEQKLAAMHCHATQLSSTPWLHAPEERQRLFFGREYFVKVDERLPLENFLPAVLKDYLI